MTAKAIIGIATSLLTAGLIYVKTVKKELVSSKQTPITVPSKNGPLGGAPTSNTNPSQTSLTQVQFLSTYQPKGEWLDHQYFNLFYNHQHEQADYVAYRLTAGMLQQKATDRSQRFEEDLEVQDHSAKHSDYTGSGYDRGHLCPSADMLHTKTANQMTFLMSNISPQVHEFNTGIWKSLEEHVRTWAKNYKTIYVVTGPILKDLKSTKTIGKTTTITVPNSYYKAVLVAEPSTSTYKAIAFILPNKANKTPLKDFAVSIDALEQQTGMDVFYQLPDATEQDVEAHYDLKDWFK